MRTPIMAAALAMSVAACGDTADNGTTASAEPADTSAASPAMAMSDYVMGAANGDMYEIESSRMALERATSEEVKQFAERMIRDHQATTAALRRHLEAQGGAMQMPASMDARHRAMIDALRAAPADQFDSLYMTQQMAAHDEALALHRGYAEGGDNAEGRALAANAVRVIEEHHQLLRAASPQGTPGQDTGRMQRSSQMPASADGTSGSTSASGTTGTNGNN